MISDAFGSNRIPFRKVPFVELRSVIKNRFPSLDILAWRRLTLWSFNTRSTAPAIFPTVIGSFCNGIWYLLLFPIPYNLLSLFSIHGINTVCPESSSVLLYVALVSLHSCFCYLHFPSTASLCSSPFHPRASLVCPDSSLHFVPELTGSDFPDSGTNSASAYWGSSCFAP